MSQITLATAGTNNYSWLWETIDNLNEYTDEMIKQHVMYYAERSFDNAVDAEGYEGNFDQYLNELDHDAAIKAMTDRRDELNVEAQLNAVVTPKEVADLGWAKEDTVRDACQNDWVTARKSGSTWLLLRSEAKARWGGKNQD